MQPVFDAIEGVHGTLVGYCGGNEETADYKSVCTGSTDHAEVIAIDFDPDKVNFLSLLDIFWKNIDPTTQNQQFVDHGRQYRTAIFYTTESQQKKAIQSRQKLVDLKKFDKPIVTEIEAASPFYEAEEYHQKYYQKSTAEYKSYRSQSGRDEYIQCTWDSTK